MVPFTHSCYEYKLLFYRLCLIIPPCKVSVVPFLLSVVFAGSVLQSLISFCDLLPQTICQKLYQKNYFQEQFEAQKESAFLLRGFRFAANKDRIKVYILYKQFVWRETQESAFLTSSLVPRISWMHGPYFEQQETGIGSKGLKPVCHSWDCVTSGPSLLWEGSPRRCLTVCGLCFAFCPSHLLTLPEQSFNFEGLNVFRSKAVMVLAYLTMFSFCLYF